jgi:hypothetical protein
VLVLLKGPISNGYTYIHLIREKVLELLKIENIILETGQYAIDLNSTVNALDFNKKHGYKEVGPIILSHNGLSVTFTEMNKIIRKSDF